MNRIFQLLFIFSSAFIISVGCQSNASTATNYQTSSTNNFKGRIEYVMNDNENNGEYLGGLKITSGSIKVGEIINGHDDADHPFSIKVVSILDNATSSNVQEAKAGVSYFITLQTTNKLKLPFAITGGFTFGNSNPAATSKLIAVTMNENGQHWEGENYYNSSSYFPNGNSLLNTSNPYLTISFVSQSLPDDRQLTFLINNYKGGIGKLTTNLEIGFTGSSIGNKKQPILYSNKISDGGTGSKLLPIQFEFTRWEKQAGKIIVSGKFSGTIPETFSKTYSSNVNNHQLIIKDGVFENLEIAMY